MDANEQLLACIKLPKAPRGLEWQVGLNKPPLQILFYFSQKKLAYGSFELAADRPMTTRVVEVECMFGPKIEYIFVFFSTNFIVLQKGAK